MAYYDLDGILVRQHDGQPVVKGSMKLDEIVSITSDTVQDRLSALNFQARDFNSSSVFFYIRLPGSTTTPETHTPTSLPSVTFFLPHAPAETGLWANSLVASRKMDFSTVLPQVEQRISLSEDHIVLFTPNLKVDQSKGTLVMIDEYRQKILDVWQGIHQDYATINVLCFGNGGAALTLALAADETLRNKINKISFVDCEEIVAKALASTVASNQTNFWQSSVVSKLLSNRAIMFKLDEKPIWSILKGSKESGCACPVVSIGTTNQEEVMFQGGALGIAYFRKSKSAISTSLLSAIAAVLLVLFTALLFLTTR